MRCVEEVSGGQNRASQGANPGASSVGEISESVAAYTSVARALT